MLDWHSCQIYYPLEIKILLLLLLLEREMERERDRETTKNKANKSQTRYLTYIRGGQEHPTSQNKMKHFVFYDNFHQIVYIIPPLPLPKLRTPVHPPYLVKKPAWTYFQSRII